MEKEPEKRKNYKIHENGTCGEVQIADEVIAAIAALAATEVDGVAEMAGNLTNEIIGKLGVKHLSKGVKVDLQDKTIAVELTILLQYGYPIPKVSKMVQERVKAAIENMTGLQVRFVNLKIAGITMAAEK